MVQTLRIVCLLLLFAVEDVVGAVEAESTEARPVVTWESSARSISVVAGKSHDDTRSLGVWWIAPDGTLRAAADFPVEPGAASQTLTLPTTPRWLALSGGQLWIIPHGDAAEPATLAVPTAASPPSPGKPMSHGVLAQPNRPRLYWYVDDEHTLIWNGEPYIPFGGMFCSPVLSFYDRTKVPIDERWRQHAEALDQVQAAGFTDLYANLAHGPTDARQRVVDDFNRRGLRFGWQLPSGSTGPIEGYLLRRNQRQGLLIGTCDEASRLQVRLPRERLLGLLLVSTEGSVVRRVAESIDLSVPGRHPGFIQMDEVTQADDKTVAVVLRVDGLSIGNYYVLPHAAVNSHASNVWGQTDEILRRHAWIREINWGDGLRFFVDPILNEEGIYNQAEPVRVWTEAFNAAYAGWLRYRYGSVAELCAAWRLEDAAVRDFEEASRLVPLRDAEAAWGETSIRWIDPVSLRVLPTRGGLGQGWFDYLDGVRETYADCRDDVARRLKAWVNVPIVLKRVTPWVSREAINRTPGGFDGVGLELYPAGGSVVSVGLAAGMAEAKLASQTMWVLATELGYSAAPDNRGVRGWPDQQGLRESVRTTAAYGARGFMFFGWRLEPYEMWKNMQLHAMPEQLAWLAGIRKELRADWPAPRPLAHAFPEGQNWWWRVGGDPLTRYNAVLDGPPSAIRQSVMLTTDDGSSPALWAVSSTPLLPNTAVRVTNLHNVDAVVRYGPQIAEWIGRDEKVIYLGLLPPAAKVRGLDRHFEDRRVEVPGGQIQVLRELAGDEVLARYEGLPWAKRTGNLLIVAHSAVNPEPNQAEPPPALDPRWVEDLLRSDTGRSR